MKKTILGILIALLCMCIFTGCEKHEYTVGENAKIILEGETARYTDGSEEEVIDNIKVKFEIENGGVFVMELYPKYAPTTVANFCDLVNGGFYNGLTFHRVIPGFIVQSGDPTGLGNGGSEDKIEGEFKANEYEKNTLKHEKGTVSMARTDDYNSASSQFFICLEEDSSLDGQYAAFGKVVYGMDTVDEIGEATTDENDKPLVNIVIKKASIITNEEYSKYPKEEN